MILNPDKHALGRLCRHNHEFAGTGRSVRFKSSGGCVVCHSENAKRWRKANPEKEKDKSRQWSKANPEKNREKAIKWYQANQEKVREYQKEYYQANRERILEKIRSKKAMETA